MNARVTRLHTDTHVTAGNLGVDCIFRPTYKRRHFISAGESADAPQPTR